MTATVGILGAYGAVGRAVVRQLRARGHNWQLRIGGRRVAQLRHVLKNELSGGGEVCVVDTVDRVSLKRFSSGCQVVVNCTGPSHQTLAKVARAAITAGADYIDPAGDERLFTRLAEGALSLGQRRMILSAGMLPGLSGILPRWLALHFERCDRLTAFVGIFDRFTPGGASDFLAGLDRSESLAAWKHGERVTRSARRLKEIELPFFRFPVTAHPYLSVEAECLARELGLEESRWYNVFVGNHLLAVLDRVAGRAHLEGEIDAAVRDITHAAELDVAGRDPYQIFLFQMEGVQGGTPSTQSFMLKSTSASKLTGLVAALAVEAALGGRLGPGVHAAAQVLNPGAVMQHLRVSPIISGTELFDGALTGDSMVEDGTV